MSLEQCYKAPRCRQPVVGYVVMIRAHGSSSGGSGMELPVCRRHAAANELKGKTVRYVQETEGV